MDSWVFQIARKICIIAFGANIFIHAIIGASTANGILKGSLSMIIMLILLVIFSKCDLKHRVNKNKKNRKTDKTPEKLNNEVIGNE